jgi:hypothetical protein
MLKNRHCLMEIPLISFITLAIMLSGFMIKPIPAYAESATHSGWGSPMSLPADGVSTAVCTVNVKVDGDPLAGRQVDFALRAGYEAGRELSQDYALTDANGNASITIKSTVMGDSYVDPRIDGYIVGSPIKIIFTTIPTSLELQTEPEIVELPSGALKTAYKVTALVKDSAGDPIENSTVAFSTDFSQLTKFSQIIAENGTGSAAVSAMTDATGTATVYLFPTNEIGVATITAIIEAYTSTPIDTTQVIFPSALFAGGDGSVGNRYLVSNASQLNNVRNHLDKHFKQTANIDLSGYSAGAGWVAIGSSAQSFSGTYDGDGYTISNLTINLVGDWAVYVPVGLFRNTGATAEISNLTLQDVNVGGCYYAASLVGNNSGRITNVSSNGTVVGEWDTGGLVGRNTGSIIDSDFAGTVSCTYEVEYGDWTGGLVGYNEGSISNCRTDAAIDSLGDCIGGLVGENRPSGVLINLSPQAL